MNCQLKGPRCTGTADHREVDPDLGYVTFAACLRCMARAVVDARPKPAQRHPQGYVRADQREVV